MNVNTKWHKITLRCRNPIPGLLDESNYSREFLRNSLLGCSWDWIEWHGKAMHETWIISSDMLWREISRHLLNFLRLSSAIRIQMIITQSILDPWWDWCELFVCLRPLTSHVHLWLSHSSKEEWKDLSRFGRTLSICYARYPESEGGGGFKTKLFQRTLVDSYSSIEAQYLEEPVRSCFTSIYLILPQDFSTALIWLFQV